MSSEFIIPCKMPIIMNSPYSEENLVKYRFYADVNTIPDSLLNWMSTNPREQNLNSPVAQTIAESLLEPHHEFHLRNRGILMSAESVKYKDGNAHIVFSDPVIHGNIDGGHTLRIILAAEKPLPEKYVEFEVLTGLTSAIETAEARNTSAAMDIRSLEEARNTFEVFKKVFDGKRINGGDLFSERIEWKQNQQADEKNRIDIRTVIAIFLMFNQDLFPISDTFGSQPLNLYGAKETAMKQFLNLAPTREERNEILEKMSPLFLDILTLWDTVEMEFGTINKSYGKKPFVQKAAAPKAMFSGRPASFYVPQAIMFPLVGAFRMLVQVDDSGTYSWAIPPLSVWEAEKKSLSDTIIDTLKTHKDTLSRVGKNKMTWQGLSSNVKLGLIRIIHKAQPTDI